MFNSPAQGISHMTNFRIGDAVKNLRTQGDNAGKTGKIVDVYEDVYGNEMYKVRYSDGSTGKTDEPERYYQKVATNGYKSGTTRKVSGTTYRESKNFMNEAVNAVKRLTMSAEEKALIKAGLKTEYGLYTDEAIAVILQDLCAENVARLNTVATAILADRKEEKEDAS